MGVPIDHFEWIFSIGFTSRTFEGKAVHSIELFFLFVLLSRGHIVYSLLSYLPLVK